MMRVLPREFYERDPELVARDLLGKRLLRRIGEARLEEIIVEAEAYYGLGDPASRAYRGMKSYNRLMWDEPGILFIYNVHNYWMLNVVAHEPGGVRAVLIRAVEPVRGIEVMRRNRGVDDLLKLASDPGRLTRAFGIDKSLNGVSVTSEEGEVQILDNRLVFEIGSSRRVGVRMDLDRDLRFFVKGCRFVSR